MWQLVQPVAMKLQQCIEWLFDALDLASLRHLGTVTSPIDVVWWAKETNHLRLEATKMDDGTKASLEIVQCNTM